MTVRPSVTVIIPAYNRARTLGRCLASVLNQSYADFEIIVVDDGSTDETSVLAGRLTDKRIRWERHAVNRGAAAARNTGIQAAAGQWVAFLDSDDEWLRVKLERQMAALRTDPGGAMGVCSGLFLHDGDRGVITEKRPRKPSSWHKQLLLGCDLSPGTTLVAARDCFQEVGLLDERLRRLEDWDWLLRFVQRFELAVIPEPLARVYRHGHVRAAWVEDSTLRLVERYREESERYGVLFRRQFLARRWLHLSWLFFSERGWGKGASYLARALWQDPFPRAGMILLIADAVLGSRISPRTSALRRRLTSRPWGDAATVEDGEGPVGV